MALFLFAMLPGWVEAFLERGMDVNAADSCGNTGLHAAQTRSTIGWFVCSSRLALPQPAESPGSIPLMLAAANNDPDIVAVLPVPTLSLRNTAGETAAEIAEGLGHTEVLELLRGG